MKKLISILLLLATGALLLFADISLQNSRMALTLWFEKLVPGMFVSMILIKMLYKQQVLPKLCPAFLGHLLHLDKGAMAVVISSMLLGFPTGSLLIEEACQQRSIPKKAAQRLFLICCFPTPGFTVLSCGIGIYHSAVIGWLLYLSQLLCGLCFLWFTRCTPVAIPVFNTQTSFMNDLGNAMKESGLALFLIGGYLMIFTCITGILFSSLPEGLSTLLRIPMEFSSGMFLIQSTHLSYFPSLLASCALLGFGGFCVHMQIYSMVQHCKAPYGKFFFYRILQAGISILLFCVLYHLFV